VHYLGIHPYNEVFTERRNETMDPITFGMVFTGATGGTLLALTALGKKISINETMVKLTMEIAKYGTILYLFNHIFKLFL
jgi:hypothetical protein